MRCGVVVKKSKIKTALKIIISIICGLLIGSYSAWCHYEKSSKPYTWGSNDPIILNCIGPELSEEKIRSSLEFWAEYGDTYAFIENNPSKSTCENDFLRGFIMLKEVPTDSLDGYAIAKTRSEVKFMRIVAATIYFESGTWNLQWLTEHELGHAFGYKHVPEKGNIMHPFLEFQKGKYWD